MQLSQPLFIVLVVQPRQATKDMKLFYNQAGFGLSSPYICHFVIHILTNTYSYLDRYFQMKQLIVHRLELIENIYLEYSDATTVT